jgi:lysophospholipase L1-like esterase
MRQSTEHWFCALALAWCCGCSTSNEQPVDGVGGSQSAGGTATGGVTGTGGLSTGGTLAIGGTSARGGSTASGGTGPSGGTSSSGGTTVTGGATATGGKATGGTATGGKATGGTATGGTATGGAPTGGRATGGTATGGAPTGGRATGGAATGGTGGTGAVPACTTNQISICTGTNPIECHLGGNPGDYEVTVDLGGSAAGDMYIEAESYRRMLGQTTTSAGQTKRFSFFVNVRQPEGQPVQATADPGIPGLDVYIRGTTPQLSAICYQMKKPTPKVWIAGDSTVCDQSGTDYAGWGQHLPQFFNVPVSVANYADSGESSGSFLGSSKMWGAIKAGWTAGDWVIIQVGHNDKTTDAATFQSNMTAYVTQAKAAGVHPILCTPTSRVGYALAAEHVNSVGANLPQIIRDLGTSQNVPVIDLTVTTWNWLQTIDWTQYFALGTDHTHTNPKGAGAIAGFVRDAIRTQNIGLAPYLR